MTASPPLILITNDDGIHSPGLHAVVEAVADLGELLVVAPHYQQSATGRNFAPITDPTIYRHNLTAGGKTITAYSFKGSPAQVVTIALLDLAPRPITLAISGINFGENVGSSITSSGTVCAALEAACAGVPALAVSRETPQEYYFSHSTEIDFSAAAHFTRYFARKILQNPVLPADVDILKIDVPAAATPQTPWRVTTVSRQTYHRGLPSSPEKRGLEVELAYTIEIDAARLEPDSDVRAVFVDKVVSVTPVSINLSSRVSLSAMQARLDSDCNSD